MSLKIYKIQGLRLYTVGEFYDILSNIDEFLKSYRQITEMGDYTFCKSLVLTGLQS